MYIKTDLTNVILMNESKITLNEPDEYVWGCILNSAIQEIFKADTSIAC